MKLNAGTLRLSATDLSNHLTCRHITQANRAHALGERAIPPFAAPDAAVLAQRGLEHEQAYVRFLKHSGLAVVDLSSVKSEPEALTLTLQAIAMGVDAIVQPVLADGHWFGRPDILRKVQTGADCWSYEPYDCKLTADTKAATIIQLLHYAALLTVAQQGREPANIHVVTPSAHFTPETYRILDFAAYYRSIQSRLNAAIEKPEDIYPEPTGHCEICRWRPDCDRRRRTDDHLSLTAGITRLQRKQLVEWDVPTLAALANLQTPLTRRPRHGSKDSYFRIQNQARVQVMGRVQKQPIHELILPIEIERGLSRLPEPSPADIFFDFESDPFAGPHGCEYLFGFTTVDNEYHSHWAVNPSEEKAAFEWFIDLVMARWQANPALHIYHYGHKEPSTLKTLMGRYATREDELDRMLRAGILIDLHSITKQALRASVERYSLKTLEEFHNFQRSVPLEDARYALRLFQHALELSRDHVTDPALRQTIARYNADDCKSTRSLRDWLETLRAQQGPIARPPIEEGDPSPKVSDRQATVQSLSQALFQDTSADQPACQLLANLLDWHRREDKSAYHEKYRLQDLPAEELQDERAAIGGLIFLKETPAEGKKKNPLHEYSFPPQETNLQAGDKVYSAKVNVGTIEYIDPAKGIVGIRRSAKSLDTQPQGVFCSDIVNTDEQANSLIRLAQSVLQNGIRQSGPFKAATDLLLRCPTNDTDLRHPGEDTLTAAKRLINDRGLSVVAIQGPPGSGKTYTAARMILECLRLGLRVGVTASGHKVIRKLLDDVHQAASQAHRQPVLCVHKITDKSDVKLPSWLTETTSNPEAFAALHTRECQILAGTAWLWSRAEATSSVDVLFVDEAGQMSLANALAIAPAAKTLVLLGDPQQLEQPLKGSHPDGADVSALQHLLEDAKTMPPRRGLFIEKTRRLHPDICRFTSEMFYDNLLMSEPGLENQRIEGHPWLGNHGLRYVPVVHTGNQNSSLEEADRIVELVESLLAPGVNWVDAAKNRRPLRREDILIVAPYNAQVALLSQRLPAIHTGTVDKFQGQQAPVVIYSLTTSTPEDAPRGMEFLYSVNRLNVATSRAKALCILVASPKLLEPECKTPRQLKLANALCRYAELAEFKQARLVSAI